MLRAGFTVLACVRAARRRELQGTCGRYLLQAIFFSLGCNASAGKKSILTLQAALLLIKRSRAREQLARNDRSTVLLSSSSPLVMRLAASRLPIQSIRARSNTSRRSSPRAMATAESSAYSALCERLREANALSSVAGLLGWDEQVTALQLTFNNAA